MTREKHPERIKREQAREEALAASENRQRAEMDQIAADDAERLNAERNSGGGQ
ncbi:MAG: hypothetical protein WBA97_34940 [Actinophytocola sp.]|uniref:hypothetical protein n=1 Tax=Actinophytocola sp. TaxID=1872138 RepID=UPI003C73F54F